MGNGCVAIYLMWIIRQIVDLDKLKEDMIAAVKEGIEAWKKSVIEIDIHHPGDGFYNLIKETKCSPSEK